MNSNVLCAAVFGVFRQWFMLVTKGQKPEYEILQTAHRLEKGLLNNNPKPLWGWDKANRIASLLPEESKSSFAAITGQSVLRAYVENKRCLLDEGEIKLAEKLASRLDLNMDYWQGGILSIKKDEVLMRPEEVKVCEKLFNSRHSVREFTKEKVKQGDLEAAIQLALRSPSACNRQSTRIYVDQNDGRQSLYLTGDVRAFSTGEFSDWIVSTSIFAGYLSLALHLYGIGACFYRKPLYGNSMKETIDRCHIPNNEMIIIELQFGYYKDTFKVAYSNRMEAKDVTSFI